MLDKLEDKQIILISGTEGKEQIFEIVKKVVSALQKPFLVFKAGEENSLPINNEPVAIILCEEKDLLNYNHHISLISNIKDTGIQDFERYVRNFEKMVDQTPKAGTVIFHEDDSISAVICKKERADVTPVEFTSPAIKHSADESIFNVSKEEIILKNCDAEKAFCVKAAFALLKILRIKEKIFIDILEK